MQQNVQMFLYPARWSRNANPAAGAKRFGITDGFLALKVAFNSGTAIHVFTLRNTDPKTNKIYQFRKLWSF
jgi:hypothetical protein